jgi:hypothetical protein
MTMMVCWKRFSIQLINKNMRVTFKHSRKVQSENTELLVTVVGYDLCAHGHGRRFPAFSKPFFSFNRFDSLFTRSKGKYFQYIK